MVNSYEHILKLSIKKNRFPAKNQTLTLGCYRVLISPNRPLNQLCKVHEKI